MFTQMATGAAIAAGSISIDQKAALQVVMQQHIQTSLVDGAYLYLDRKTGEIRKLYPARAHPVIFAGRQVLRSVFRLQGQIR